MATALLSALAADVFGGDGGGASSFDHEGAERREATGRAEELALVARVREGDEEAFREVVRRYFPSLSRFTAGFVEARDAADDIAQELLARFWEERAQWTITQSLKAYLFAAARNRALNERKHQAVQVRAAAAIAESIESRAASEASVVDRMILDEAIMELRRLVQQLPERRRTALRLRYEEGLTYPAIADVLAVSVKSAEQLVALTVQSLRQALRRFR